MSTWKLVEYAFIFGIGGGYINLYRYLITTLSVEFTYKKVAIDGFYNHT